MRISTKWGFGWHVEQEYHLGSICTHNGESYQSLQNANVGSQPPSAKWTPVLTSKNGLENLGLTYFADRGSLALQDFAGPLSSKDSVTATSPDGTTRKISLNATNGLQIVIYDGGSIVAL